MNKEQMFLYLLKYDKMFKKYPKTYINLMMNENIKKRYLYIKELEQNIENEHKRR